LFVHGCFNGESACTSVLLSKGRRCDVGLRRG
jgi:hypothetical protein